MAKDSMKQLKDEHTVVLQKLDSLEQDLNNLHSEKTTKNINEFLKFFNNDVELHLKKEENVLFPILEEFFGKEEGPIKVMLLEHEDLRRNARTIASAIKTKSWNNIRTSGMEIINTLRPHIDKENNVLFMMAEMHMSEKQKLDVLKKMNKIEENFKPK